MIKFMIYGFIGVLLAFISIWFVFGDLNLMFDTAGHRFLVWYLCVIGFILFGFIGKFREALDDIGQ